MNGGKAFTLCLIVFATMCLSLGRALADDVSNTRTPFSGTIFDECSGEIIDYTGITHQIITSTIDSTGVQHYTDHVDVAETAIGETSGNSYVGRGESEFSTDNNLVDNTFSTITQTVSVQLIGQGDVPNLYINNLFHITISQGNGIGSFSFDSEVVCQAGAQPS